MKATTHNSLSLLHIFSNNLYEFLSFAISLLNELETLNTKTDHINPEHILIEKKELLYIVKFEFKNKVDQFAKEFFLSPELKKEIKRDIDQRSILYSIGVIFHVLLTKEYPTITTGIYINFSSNESIPQAIQLIVEKLICRYPEDRYQSINGLKSDIQKAKNELDKTGEIKPFYPGIDDKPIDLKFNNYIYGRDNELELLTVESDEKKDIKSKMYIIKGPSGIGKSLLAEKAFEQINSEKTFKIKCKCEQIQKDKFKLISEIIEQILTYINSQLIDDNVREKTIAITKNYKNVISNLPSKTINSKNEKYKQNNIGSIFIDIFSSILKKYKIILLIDDIQWMDTTSLIPIISAMGYLKNNLTIIATSRENFETNDSLINYFFKNNQKPPDTILNAFNQIKTIIVPLKGLNKIEIAEQIEDLLLCNMDDAEKLSNVLYHKTEGNPLYIQQLLVSFKERNLIWFDNKKKMEICNYSIDTFKFIFWCYV